MEDSSYNLGLAQDIADLTSETVDLYNRTSSALLIFRIVLALYKPSQSDKQEFGKVKQNMEKIENQLKDISSLLSPEMYSEPANDITFQMKSLLEYMQSDESNKNTTRDDFFRTYENFGEDQGMQIVNSNLPKILNAFAAKSYCNKSYMKKIGNILMDLLRMAVSCSYSYKFLNKSKYTKFLDDWSNKLVESYRIIKDYDNICVNKVRPEAERLIRDQLKDSSKLTQQKFTDQLHQLLSSTYDWLSWMVVVYDGDVQSSFNVYSCCNGIHVKGSKNVQAYYTKKQTYIGKRLNQLHIVLKKRFHPKIIAKNLYNFLRNYGVTGPIFVCKQKYGITRAYDKEYMTSDVTGRLFVANFVSQS